MTYYIGVVDRGGEGDGVWSPDLPGCTSGGKTMDDLFTMATEAVALWIGAAVADGEPAPEPRSVAALRTIPEVLEAIKEDEDVTFIQIPLLLDEQRSVRANISLDAGLLTAIDAAAKQSGLTRSAFLASAARDKIKRV